MTFTSSQSRTLVGLAVASVLAAPSIASAAATAVDYRLATPTAVTIAKELLATKVTTITTAVAYVPVPMTADYSVGGANSFYMTIVLGTGLTAKASPNLACKVITGGTSATNYNIATLQSGGAGKSTFTFAIKTGTTLAGNTKSGFCFLASGTTGITFTNSGLTNKTISWKSTRVVGGANASVSASSKSFITFAKGASASITVGSSGGLINVAANSMKLTSGATKPATDLISVAGTVYYTPVAGIVGATAGSLITATAFSKSAMLTIAGDPVATSKSVFVVAGGATCVAGNSMKSAVPASGKVTFTGAGIYNGLAAGVKVCLSFSGTTAITAGQITATLASQSPSTLGYNPDFGFSPDNNLLLLKKNGKSAKVFSLAPPNSTALVNDTSNVRLTNLGSSSGAVRATLYKGDGTVVISGVLLTATDFPKGSSVNFTFQQILDKLGTTVAALSSTAPTGSVGNYVRPWLQVDGEVSDMTVMHTLVRNNNGVPAAPVNLSSTVIKE